MLKEKCNKNKVNNSVNNATLLIFTLLSILVLTAISIPSTVAFDKAPLNAMGEISNIDASFSQLIVYNNGDDDNNNNNNENTNKYIESEINEIKNNQFFNIVTVTFSQEEFSGEIILYNNNMEEIYSANVSNLTTWERNEFSLSMSGVEEITTNIDDNIISGPLSENGLTDLNKVLNLEFDKSVKTTKISNIKDFYEDASQSNNNEINNNEKTYYKPNEKPLKLNNIKSTRTINTESPTYNTLWIHRVIQNPITIAIILLGYLFLIKDYIIHKKPTKSKS